MNLRLAIAIITVITSTFSGAQNAREDLQPDPTLDAIRQANKDDMEPPKRAITVVDPAPSTPQAAIPPDPQAAPAALAPDKPTVAIDLVKPPAQEPANPVATTLDAPPSKPDNGLAVRVEKIHSGKGSIDSAQVKLNAPFPAKPLTQAPPGWRLATSDSAPPFTREVEIAPGSKITLTIHPHLLIPDADGAQVFTISEPGYNSALCYQQTATVGAILSNSIRQLDDESKQLGQAIDSLQQLLISLPKSESPSVPKAQPLDPAPLAPLHKR